ncbi:RelA/SpoT domain-containing protein [Acinetobacter baumannii]|uniref:(P)ppGpp synthetase n=3 Tax=Acinetobacter baumannii TaxID=470 RepID=A0A7Z2BFP6_ACIBA|nr:MULTISPECIES: RelA/SpoT domain-containing protein [Acinetobacter]AKQ29919.1 (p)ppGpp synthetase [Acinetobacter baumannii]EHU1442004.1 RelA/SpoT domain-containing protein [Acinetobacter baumannii]EHU1771959.1 RelA/SpoT domain-containing protein [Acinetobacter baumannii]EHU1810552.1 RelA/SpoT domain-containing protein [Acinetobacter baumannii]EHU1977130.1 RelA/SpoT domain-containing protein [Acinetobacter baumannii]
MSIDEAKLVVPGTNVLRRAGAALISDTATQVEKIEAYNILNNWRALHSYPIDVFQKNIRSKCTQLKFRDFTVAQRLKRMPSIISKLQRNPRMNLARMQDIGGVRVILPSIADVRKLHEALVGRNNRFNHVPIVPCHDYIENPKSDGYRSIHQVFTYKSRDHSGLDGLKIELQIRTALQHSWATAVETLGVIENASIKSGFGSDEIRRFLKLSSALFSIKEGTPVVEEFSKSTPEEIAIEAKDIEQRLQIFTKLKWLQISAKHIESTSNSRHAYHLLILKQEENSWKVNVIPFTKAQEEIAQTMYATLESQVKQEHDVDIVLVSVGDMKAIKKAYPNYFLDTNQFIKEMQSAFKKYT